MGAWGGGSYLKTVAKNLETARVSVDTAARAHADRRHLGALAA